ncbi:MAG: M48 family metallopeptidase [Rickettsiales bacterium]
MFAKPFNLILVYILCIVNLLILFLPFIIIAAPIFIYDQNNFLKGLTDTAYLSFFLVSSIMLFYLFLDTIFGFTIWSLTKKCKNIKKYHKKYPYTLKISENFSELQNSFATKNIKLLIAKSSEVNAYAIGSIRRNIVVITLGLLAHVRKNAASEEEFQTVIKCIMAHEISHLVNKDFLPALLLFANQKATSIVAKIFGFFFNSLIRLVYTIPFIGSLITSLILLIHKITKFLLNFFFRFILVKIFNFLKLYVSRNNEFRCDYQAAKACGGANMANALTYLGNNGYFTIFSSHPRTISRIRHVQNVQITSKKVRASFINRISNFSSILILFILLDISWNYVNKLEYLNIKTNMTVNNIMTKQKYYLNIISDNLKELLK